jgi:hypothetical protein
MLMIEKKFLDSFSINNYLEYYLQGKQCDQ